MSKLEVCAGDIESVKAAALGGAYRVELCSALALDGLTPSAGMIEEARKVEGIRLHVLIRPREGDFVYNEEEIRMMEHDIALAKRLGADGVVIGALTPERDIDLAVCQRLVDAAQGVDVTFHRAFDQCRDPKLALEQIITLGCSRLLTSGQAPSAVDSIPLLRELVKQADGRIIIMPGAGVSPDNARRILDATGATEIHGSLRTKQGSRLVTDAEMVKLVQLSITSPLDPSEDPNF